MGKAIDPATAAAAASIPRNSEPSCFRMMCGCRYNPSVEWLEYDYARVATKPMDGEKQGKTQPPPRIRQRGEYYIDSFNGEPWTCSFGTNEEVGNRSHDQTGFAILDIKRFAFFL